VANLSYISPRAAVGPSPIHGRGLFATAPIAKGGIVCIKGGYVFDRRTLSGMPDSSDSRAAQMSGMQTVTCKSGQ
jgi:hypothetical protein